MSKIYAGLYHIKGTVKTLGIEGLEPYKGNINADVLLVDDCDTDTTYSSKALVDILDFKGERVPAYVLMSKLVKVPHEPVLPLDAATRLKREREAYQKNYGWLFNKSSAK